MEPFDIVWFTAENGERAMRSLSLLPGGEEERIARGKSHHFRGWLNSPGITEGGQHAGLMHCVCVDIPGSEKLEAGRIESDGTLYVFQFCTQVVEVCPGFLGGWIKPETWERPEFVEAANVIRYHEANTKVKLDALTDEKERMRSEAIQRVEKAYWKTAAYFVLPPGSPSPRKIQLEELRNIVTMGILMKKKVLPIEVWMQSALAALPPLKEEKPYDPVTFLAHGATMAEVARDLAPREDGE